MSDMVKPLQRLTWDEKIARNKEWFKNMADYYIQNSHFTGVGTGRKSMQTMYEVYNNKIPLTWFNHITDPLSAQNAQHKNFPAKVRPTNILRTNIDLLLGEYPRRPFRYRVENLGEGGYNNYLEGLNNAIHQNVTEMFKAFAQQEAEAMGVDPELTTKAPEEIPLPETVKETFHSSYKDKQAIRGQKWMKRAIVEYGIRRKLHKMFKDWLIAGETISYKNIHHGELDYRRLSPLYSDYDKSEDTDFIEDGQWFTHVFFMTVSDVVDMFYDELEEEHHKKLEHYTAGQSSPSVMYDYLSKTIETQHQGKIPVYLVLHKARKKIAYVQSVDPTTGEMQEDVIDEVEIPLLPKGTKYEVDWVNEVYETWRIGDHQQGMYMRMQPVPAQRNAMNNFSVCKLPANGRKYSDTHSENISVMQIGIPYLIMYMITGRALELTIAKSKGKILIMDNNAIPRGKGWNEEKFFYYSEAMGYGLIDRNQIGVDKSFNQYQVVDMSLYDQIEQLINMQAHFKQEWDDIIGISRQRKGQTMATETNASNQGAVFQSTVITEMIFAGFEEFVEKELQGLLDLSKFTNASGVRKLYNGSDLDDILFEIDPVEYCNADLGIFVTDNPQDYGALEAMKAQVPNFVQNGVKASTIFEMFQAGNVAELSAKLKYIEELEAQAAQSQQQAEFDAEERADERKMRFMEYEKMLEEQLLISEYEQRKELAALEAEFNMLAVGAQEDADGDGVPDTVELMKRQSDREKIIADNAKADKDRSAKERMEVLKAHLAKYKIDADQEKEDRKHKLEREKMVHETKMKEKEVKNKERESQAKIADNQRKADADISIKKQKAAADIAAKKKAASKPKPKK